MKSLQIIVLVLLFSFKPVNDTTQKYSFDYKLEYKVTNYKDNTKNHTITYYINSKDNSYFAYLKTLNKTESEFKFLDQNGKSVLSKIQNSDIALFEVEGLTATSFSKYFNPFKYQINNYDFFKLTDTIVDEKKQSRYLLKNKSPKHEKRKKLWRNIYTIDSTKSIKPLLVFATAYEIWINRKNLPQGFITQLDQYNNEKKLEISEKLTKTIPLNFTMKLNEN